MNKATFDPARRLDLYFRCDRAGSKNFVFAYSDGTPYSFIYEEFQFYIYRYQGEKKVLLELLTVSNQSTLTSSITVAQSNIDAAEYYYELFNSQTNETWLCGDAIFHNGKFDGVSTDTEDVTIQINGELINITLEVTPPSSVGVGSVTSVGGFSPLFTVTNPTSTPTFVAVNQNANLVYAGPETGAAAAPTFRALVAADIPLTSTQVAFGDASNKITSSANLTFEAATTKLFINTNYLDLRLSNRFIGIAIGNQTLSGEGNTGLGNNALTNLTTGAYNVAIGYFPAQAITTGQSNTFINHGAGAQTTTGFYNLGIGFHAVYLNTTSSWNIGLGAYTLDEHTSGDGNIDIGGMAAANTADYLTGSKSVKIGFNVTMPATTGNGQLNIQNAIFGAGNEANTTSTSSGTLGVYVRIPTAHWHIGAGTTAAGTAPLKINDGPLMTAPENGAIENNGTNLYYTNSSTVRSALFNLTFNNNAGQTVNGTWTANANNQFHLNFAGAITGTATNNDVLFGYRFTPSLTLNNAASTQTAVGVDIIPTFTGGTGPIYIATRITGSGTNDAQIALRIRDAGLTTVFDMTNAGNMTGKSGSSWSIGSGTFTLNTITAGNNSTNLIFNSPTSVADPFIIRSTGSVNYTASTDFVSIRGGITNSGGAFTYRSMVIEPNYNLSGGTTTTIGIDYVPTYAASTGLTDLAFRAQTGAVLLGGATLTTSAILDLQSTTKAFIPPRMTGTQRDNIATPSAGMVIYNTTTNKLNLYTTGWEAITSA